MATVKDAPSARPPQQRYKGAIVRQTVEGTGADYGNAQGRLRLEPLWDKSPTNKDT